jgi:predicted nucleic acid-binding Zn ribbon protein
VRLKRDFETDLEHCSNCGSEFDVIAAILAVPAIKRPRSGSAVTTSTCSAGSVQRRLRGVEFCDL